MKTTHFHDNAIQLTRYGFVNCYLVRESDGFTLIDTGVSGSAGAIIAAADAAGAPIRRILLTHAHVDHVGSVDALSEKLGRIEIVTSERSLPLLRKPPDKSLRPGEAPGKIKGGLNGITSTVTHLVDEGELFGSLRVIETPGHIPGHLSFLDERDGTLYAGDALTAVFRLAISGWGPPLFPLTNFITWSKPVALNSIRKLVRFPIRRYACGHGKVREGGPEILRGLIAAVCRKSS
jgi:glyoxylase-like metal-dependent hydrolase (beta-lactamase superfamily II)